MKMKNLLIFFLATLISAGLTTGCAGAKSNKRARIAASPNEKATPGGEDQNGDEGTPSQEGQTPDSDADKNEGPSQEEVVFGEEGQKISDAFQASQVKGKNLTREDLKNMTLELEEISVLYSDKNIQDSSTNVVAFSTGKRVSETEFTLKDHKMAGESSVELLSLPVPMKIKLDEEGQIKDESSVEMLPVSPIFKLNEEKKEKFLDITFEKTKLSLAPLFDKIFLGESSQTESADKSEKITTVLSLSESESSESSSILGILVETGDGEARTTSFYLKYKVQTQTDQSLDE